MNDDKLKQYFSEIQKYEDENPDNKFPLAVPQKYDVVGNYLTKPLKNAYNTTTQTIDDIVNTPNKAYNGMRDASWNILKKAGFQDNSPYKVKSEFSKNIEDPKIFNNMNASQKLKATQLKNQEQAKNQQQIDNINSHNMKVAAGYGVGVAAATGGLTWLYNYINRSKKQSEWKQKGCEAIIDPQKRMECKNYIRNNTLKGLESQKNNCKNNPECIQRITDEINKEMSR